MNYFVIPLAGDDCDLPTAPFSVALKGVAQHISEWLGRYKAQGYYLNCRQERVTLDKLSFRLEPDLQLDDNGEPKGVQS